MSDDIAHPNRRPNFPEARRAHARGENVTLHLQQQLHVSRNTPEIIEMAYDLQAGSYVAYANDHRDLLDRFAAESANILDRYLHANASILDVGCGELTTLSHLVSHLRADLGPLFAFDISWSRLRIGQAYASSRLPEQAFARLRLFAAEMSEIPLPDRSIDVVISNHALEPNRGRETELLSEILRVARSHAVLFEPSYELNSAEGRARMDALGYVRGIEAAATGLGARIIDVVPMSNVTNPLNPTAAFVLENPLRDGDPVNDPVFSDPGSSSRLVKRDTCYFSPECGVSYPIIEGIPILRASAAVLTSALASELPV